MRVLLCHNYYQQPGGEDRVFAAEGELLESRGHEVIRYTVHNDCIEGMGRVDLLRRMLWNSQTYNELQALIRDRRPDVMHCHNTFPLLSPSAYRAARDAGVPVVQTLHNYRLLCLGATLQRNGLPCEECIDRPTSWPGVRHACYRHSYAASAAAAAMVQWHRWRRTWREAVDHYIALCDFSREKFIGAGFPPEKISVKPNFVYPDRGEGDGGGAYAAFVGRLSPEKGIHTLLAAWSWLRADIQLRIVGDGPLASMVDEAAAADPRITWLGACSPEEVQRTLREAACLVMPSTWYETFGLVIIEAFAAGTPVIASRMGSMRELVDHGRTGFLFGPRDDVDLADKVELLFGDRTRLAVMRRAAREEYEQRYTADINYRMLMDVYRRVGVRVEEPPLPPIPVVDTTAISGVPANV